MEQDIPSAAEEGDRIGDNDQKDSPDDSPNWTLAAIKRKVPKIVFEMSAVLGC